MSAASASDKPPRVLIIAGSDSSGGAGIQADIKTVTALGGYAMTAITAITAQNTLGVQAAEVLSPDLVVAQVDACTSDIGADAVKIGMLGSPDIAHAVADRLEAFDIPVVFDPVMVATSGSVLADEATIAAFERLMPLATVVTPNLPELEALTGLPVASLAKVEQAATALAQRTGSAVLAKGGHGDNDLLVDLLVQPDGAVNRFEAERINTRHTHGTGCTLASAIATLVGKGVELKSALQPARDYVRRAIMNAPKFGEGSGPLGH